MRFGAVRPQPVVAGTQFAGKALKPLRSAGLLSLSFLLAACGSSGSVSLRDSNVSPANLFRAGYANVEAIYIEPIPLPDLALATLHGLEALDTTISIEDQGSSLALAVNGGAPQLFAEPASDNIGAWGDLTGAIVDAVKQQSSTLASMESELVYEAMFDGLLTKLDHFSRYSTPKEAQENRASRNGFGGIGVRIEVEDAGVRVIAVYEETPAEEAGLEPNDLVVAIDGMSVEGLDQEDVISKLRGAVDSHVRLTIQREGEAPFEVDVARSHIVPQTVTLAYKGDVAHIEISGFNQSTTRTLKEKIEEAEATMGDRLVGFVLDLRGNPGGLLDQAVSVSDLFITKGRIVSTHGRHPDSHQYFEADSDDIGLELPVVVLVNGLSASASEIVAAALQDSGRALVVGSASYGKGTVQTVLRLPNEAELTITWARFHAPSGYALQGRGVLPDVCTSGAGSSAAVLNRVRRNGLEFEIALRRSDLPSLDSEAIASFRANCPASDDVSDLDLEVAEGLLRDPLLFARAQGDQAAFAQPTD